MFLPVIVVLMLTSSTSGENPAVQVILNNKGLQYGKHVGAGWIQDKLENITLPDISGAIHIVFGTVDYTLTGMTITKCDFPEPSVEFYESATGFKTSISGLSVALTGEWMTRFGLIHDGGSFNMAIFNVDVISVVKLGRDPDGHLSITSVSCDAQVGDLNIQFYGGASWIFQPIVEHYRGRIRGEIEEKICPQVEESIVNLEHHLQAMNVSFDVNQDLTLDLPLTGLPVINASSLNLGLKGMLIVVKWQERINKYLMKLRGINFADGEDKGEFYDIKTHTEPPFVAQPFTLPEQPGYMLSLGLSEFTLNSASFGCYTARLFQAIINDSMIPPESPVHLNTSSMGPFVPQLPKLFPGLLMSLQVYAREFPQFSFLPGAIALDFQGALKAFAIQPNGTQTPLFKLNIDSDFSGKVWTADGKLKGSMAMNNFTVTLATSEVGPFEIGAIQGIMKMGVTAAMTNLNKKLGEGFDLPRMKRAVLVNTVLKMEEGFIAIASDAQVLQTDRDFN